MPFHRHVSVVGAIRVIDAIKSVADAFGEAVMLRAHPAPSEKTIRFGFAGRTGNSLITAARNTTIKIGLSANCPPSVMRTGKAIRTDHDGIALAVR